MMIRKLLIKLVMKAYKMGVDNGRKRCDADINVFAKMVDEILG